MQYSKLFTVYKYVNRNTFNPRFFANRTKATMAYLSRNPFVSSYPIKLHVELTNVCNLDCIMCPRSQMKRKVGFMKPEVFKKIIDELAGKTEFSYLHLMGESVLHPQLFELIRYGKSKGVAMGMASNMTVLDEEKAQQMLASGLDFLVMSVDGITAETYEKIRLKANFETTMKNVENFLKAHKKGTPPHTVVQMIYMKGTEDLARKYGEFWDKLEPDSIRIKPFQTWMGDQDDIKALKPEVKKSRQRPCDRIWRHSVVLWDGTVVPCEFDYDAAYPVGNVTEQSMKEIWNSEKMQALRKQHVCGNREDIELCRACDYIAPKLLANIGLTVLDVKMSTKIISDFGL